MKIQTDMKFELEGTPEAQQKGRSIIEEELRMAGAKILARCENVGVKLTGEMPVLEPEE